MSLGKVTNSNMQNSIMMLSFFSQETPFLDKFSPKFQNRLVKVTFVTTVRDKIYFRFSCLTS